MNFFQEVIFVSILHQQRSNFILFLTETAEWGGDLELKALAKAINAHLHVHSAQLPEQVFKPDGPCVSVLWMNAFHFQSTIA